MSKVHFFTGINSIQNDQTVLQAYGKMADEGNFERYNLENKFTVSALSPAYAVTKSLIFAVSDAANASLINIALLPINSYTSGFPIKFFLYRGIRKDSLMNSNNKILIADTSWLDGNNILTLINNQYSKISGVPVTSPVVSSDSLGYNLSSSNDTTLLEKIFFDNNDSFHPLIVEAGCHIGKFAGASTLAGVEVLFDVIGSEPKLSLLRSSSHILKVDKLVINPSLSEKDQLILKFNNRFKKEEVLNYLDITAFYGNVRNRGLNIEGTILDNNFLARFFNRHSVYIDLRDNRGFSYNHFFRENDILKIGFYSPDTNIADPVFEDVGYYSNWPILKLDNKVFNTNKNNLFVKLPITFGSPTYENFILCYTSFLSTFKDNTKENHLEIARGTGSDSIQLNYSETIILDNWKYSNDNTLGANYFLLKKAVVGNEDRLKSTSSIWNNFFSMKMNNILGISQLLEGEFRINTYSSLNTPPISNPKGGEIYYPSLGIAFDKEHVTFFTLKNEVLFGSTEVKDYSGPTLLGKGKFIKDFNPDDYYYDPALGVNQNVGFLNQVSKINSSITFELNKFAVPDIQDNSIIKNFLSYSKSNDSFTEKDALFESFESITLTHEEYNVLKNFQDAGITNFGNHPIFIKAKNYTAKEYDRFTLHEMELTLGIPTVIENPDTNLNYVELVDTPANILINSLPISFSSIAFS
jgi:hypothetical protein